MKNKVIKGAEVTDYKNFLSTINYVQAIKFDDFDEPIQYITLDKYMFKNEDHFNRYKAKQYEAGFKFYHMIEVEIPPVISEQDDKFIFDLLSKYIESETVIRDITEKLYNYFKLGDYYG